MRPQSRPRPLDPDNSHHARWAGPAAGTGALLRSCDASLAGPSGQYRTAGRDESVGVRQRPVPSVALPGSGVAPKGQPGIRQSVAGRRLRRTTRAIAVLTAVAAAQDTARLSHAVLNQWLFSQPSVTMYAAQTSAASADQCRNR